MLRRVIAFAAVLMAGAIFLGAANTARAESAYAYRTVTKVKNAWAVRDIWRTRYEIPRPSRGLCDGRQAGRLRPCRGSLSLSDNRPGAARERARDARIPGGSTFATERSWRQIQPFRLPASGSVWRTLAMSAQGSRLKRFVRLSTVKSAALLLRSSSSHDSGAETAAPGRARVE